MARELVAFQYCTRVALPSRWLHFHNKERASFLLLPPSCLRSLHVDFRDPSVRLSTLSSLINECEHEITLLMMQAQQAGGYTTSSVAKVSSGVGEQLQLE